MSKSLVQSLAQIISQTSPALIIQQQISLAATLVAKTCREERHQNLLANFGVLDALASRLAGFIVSMGFGFPGAEHNVQGEGDFVGNTISLAPRSAQLAPTLEAIGVVISDSKYRASQLLYSPALAAVFPPSSPLDSWGASTAAAASRQLLLDPIDRLLPHVPSSQHKTAPQAASHTSTPTAFSLGGPSSRDGIQQGSRHTSSSQSRLPSHASRSSRTADQASAASDILTRFAGRASNDEDENPLISWLLYVMRAESGMTRLMAASTLTILYRAKLVHPRRETDFAHLLVPILVKMFGKPSDTQLQGATRHTSFEILDRAPTVLALLVTDSVELQKAAVEAQAIKNLSRMLKMAFDPVDQPNQPSLWVADATATNIDYREGSTILLGHSGLPRAMVEKLKLREAALKGLAALAPFRDEYRKMIIENGVTPFIVASMRPFGQVSSPKAEEAFNGHEHAQATNTTSSKSLERGFEGNPASVLIAACGAIRALSRSVSILRTSLIDAGVAMPLFDLLKSPDMEVKIAATAAVCNLLLEFSPMREVRNFPSADRPWGRPPSADRISP
jgi:armadillo repeat-containing protein 8